MGPTPILEMARAYGLHPRLWLLPVIGQFFDTMFVTSILFLSKSTGLDNIPAKALRIASSTIAPSLTFIFNLSLSSGIFIDDWKNARVCPAYKGNDRRDMGNYRPISILPIISKVFEKEVFQQLYYYLKVTDSIVSKFQSGFRPLHSTISALIQMCDDWSDNMDKGG